MMVLMTLFFILADGDETNFQEIQTNSQSRILSINVPSGTEELEIIGSVFDSSKIIETPVIETPVIEIPVIEIPVIEIPVIEIPVIEIPVIEIIETQLLKSQLLKPQLKIYLPINVDLEPFLMVMYVF